MRGTPGAHGTQTAVALASQGKQMDRGVSRTQGLAAARAPLLTLGRLAARDSLSSPMWESRLLMVNKTGKELGPQCPR